MSATATALTWQAVPLLPDLLGLVDPHRRPSFERAALVALAVADAHRDARGYADETVGQIDARCGIGPDAVSRSLRALDLVGVWTVSMRGRRGRGSRRTPGPILAAYLAGVDHTEMIGIISRCSDHTEIRSHLTVVTGSSHGGNPSISRCLTTGPPSSNPSSNRGTRPQTFPNDHHAGTSAAARALEQRTARRLAGTACPACGDTGLHLDPDGVARPCQECT